MDNLQPEVFISYAWRGESEELVNKLDAALQKKGLTLLRDKRDLGFKGLISEFMKRIGMGKAVVVVISDRYLKSPYCMFELMEIYRNRDFLDRIFPVMLKDAAIVDPLDRLGYLKYWQEKKGALEKAIEAEGPDAIAVVGDDYKIYRKIFNDFGEVVNVLKDVNALTPEMHQASDFEELFQALTQRLEIDAEAGHAESVRKLEKRLAAGSHSYYKELTGPNGPYHDLNISEAILAGIQSAKAGDHVAKSVEAAMSGKEDATPHLQTTVRNKDGEELPLASCLQDLWQQQTPHVILLGDGGMGKTVSLIHFWEALLQRHPATAEPTIPLFLTLHEYNTVNEADRYGFIAKRIVWHYLGIRENREETIDALWKLFRSEAGNGAPNLVLLLDGFNEVTVEAAKKRNLLIELQEIRQKGMSVQLVLSSRYEMNFTWAEGFQTLELQPLNEEKMRAFLGAQRVAYPEDQRLQEILRNPMMLTLYANANEIVERHKQESHYDFKPHTTTQGELLWNYLEAQLVKLARIYGREAVEFYYYKFIIRHFLPYLGYEMEQNGQFVVEEESFFKMINEACRYFYQREFIQAYPEYRLYLNALNLKELDFAGEEERFGQMIKAICGDLRLMKTKNRDYEFIHQNFRDYFAAVHVLNELHQSLSAGRISSLLVSRPLPVYLRKFAGQIKSELFIQSLEPLRGVFEEEKVGYAVWNIVNTCKQIRPHLADLDLSRLNLLKMGLQYALCYDRNGSNYHSCRFDNSLVNDNSFLPQGHSSNINSIAFHPDGKTFISGSGDGTIKAWDWRTGECLTTFQADVFSIRSVAFHPGKQFIISCSEHNIIKIWDWQTGSCVQTFAADGDRLSFYNGAAFHPDVETIVYWNRQSPAVKAYEWPVRMSRTAFEEDAQNISCVAFHPDRKTVFAGLQNGAINSWDWHSGKYLATLQGHTEKVNVLTFHPNGIAFMAGFEDGTIKSWDCQSGECLMTYQGHHRSITSMAFHPEGKTFISSGWDNTIKTWDCQSGACLATYPGQSKDVVTLSLAFHPDGTIFVSGSSDNTLRIWETQTGECLETIQGHSDAVDCVAFHPDGKSFISGGWDYTLKAWNRRTGKCLTTFRGHTDGVTNVAFHPDGRTFISGSEDYTIKVWNWMTGEWLATLKGHTSIVNCIAFHPTGEFFISGSTDKMIKVWSWRTRTCEATYETAEGSIKSLAFHPNGRIFICGLSSNFIQSRDWSTGKILHVFKGHRHTINSVAFHPREEIFISSSDDHTIRSWDLQTGECLQVFEGHPNPVTGVAFHPDGAIFISGSFTNTIKVWDLQSGKCLHTFEGQRNVVNSVAFHPEGKTLISGAWSGTVKTWDLETGKCLHTVTNIPSLLIAGCSFRNLHPESEFSPDSMDIMRQYGAIFDETDQQRWNESVQEVFGPKDLDKES